MRMNSASAFVTLLAHVASPYPTPLDKFGRKWPELRLPNHKAWTCSECGQPEITKVCDHKPMKASVVRKLGGKL
jgi:hypothetical protein